MFKKSRFKKKGFSPASILMYILGFFIGSLILIYGYKSIAYIISRGEDAMLFKFEQSLRDSVTEVAGLPGTTRIIESSALPANFNNICFLDFTKPCDSSSAQFGAYGRIICDSFDDKVSNIFLLPFTADTIKISEIRLSQNPLCIQTTNGFKVKITGQGKSALLESVE